MSRLFDQVDGFLRPPAPRERLAIVRILVGTFSFVYLAARTPGMANLGRAGFRPVGVVQILSAPLSSTWVVGLSILATLLAIPFTLGLAYRVTAPLFALTFLWVTSYRSSFGFIFHTENLTVVHALVLSVVAASDAWSLDARSLDAKRIAGGDRAGESKPDPKYGWPLKLLSIVTTLSYMIAGLTKLRVSGFGWATSDTLLNQVAYDNLRKALLGDTYSPIGAWAIGHRWLFTPLAFASLALELGSPIALFSKRIGRIWAFGMWGFHVGVLALMAIFFPYPLFGLAFASFFEPEKIVRRIASRTGQKRSVESIDASSKGAPSAGDLHPELSPEEPAE